MRDGEELKPLSEPRRRAIYAEVVHDFSAEVCEAATVADLSDAAIDLFRTRWAEKLEASERNQDREAAFRVRRRSDVELLRDAEAILDGCPTWAALILFGRREALGRQLAQAEIVFEYHATEAPGSPQQRENFREGFFAIQDRLWKLVNRRNERQDYQAGLFVRTIPTFSERPVRELILNAVAHRDYQHPGSVFLRQFPRRLRCESPGGLPVGVTPENILDRQLPRNRRIAEIFERCGLVERSGQGMDLMFTNAVRHAKLLPDFAGTDDHQVRVTLDGQVRDPAFLGFLEEVGQETLQRFDTPDFLVLNHVRQEHSVPDELKARVPRLRDLGLIESVGRGRGVRLILSRRFQEHLGAAGAHTRQRGLDEEHIRQLLLQHLRDAGAEGAKFTELQQVVPSLSEHQIRYRLNQLRDEGRIDLEAAGRESRWVFLRDLKDDSGRGSTAVRSQENGPESHERSLGQ